MLLKQRCPVIAPPANPPALNQFCILLASQCLAAGGAELLLLPVPLSTKNTLRGDSFVINLHVLELGRGGWGIYSQA